MFDSTAEVKVGQSELDWRGEGTLGVEHFNDPGGDVRHVNDEETSLMSALLQVCTRPRQRHLDVSCTYKVMKVHKCWKIIKGTETAV